MELSNLLLGATLLVLTLGGAGLLATLIVLERPWERPAQLAPAAVQTGPGSASARGRHAPGAVRRKAPRPVRATAGATAARRRRA
jgi:hypothetical protein